jgi:Protein of unknown function (DUF4236)
MGYFRFFRRVRIIPGLRMNLSKSGVSLSVGRRSSWYTIGPRGRRATLGLPPTGLFWTQTIARRQLGAERTPRGANWIELPAAIAITVILIYCAAWLQHG